MQRSRCLPISRLTLGSNHSRDQSGSVAEIVDAAAAASGPTTGWAATGSIGLLIPPYRRNGRRLEDIESGDRTPAAGPPAGHRVQRRLGWVHGSAYDNHRNAL